MLISNSLSDGTSDSTLYVLLGLLMPSKISHFNIKMLGNDKKIIFLLSSFGYVPFKNSVWIYLIQWL